MDGKTGGGGCPTPRRVAQIWRVAQAFDLVGISNAAGAPSFAHFAKGGSRECLRDRVDHASRTRHSGVP